MLGLPLWCSWARGSFPPRRMSDVMPTCRSHPWRGCTRVLVPLALGRHLRSAGLRVIMGRSHSPRSPSWSLGFAGSMQLLGWSSWPGWPVVSPVAEASPLHPIPVPTARTGADRQDLFPFCCLLLLLFALPVGQSSSSCCGAEQREDFWLWCAFPLLRAGLAIPCSLCLQGRAGPGTWQTACFSDLQCTFGLGRSRAAGCLTAWMHLVWAGEQGAPASPFSPAAKPGSQGYADFPGSISALC